MGVSFTCVRWKMRFGKKHERYGDDYTGVGDLVKIGSEGWIEGMAGTGFTKSIRESIERFCIDHGMGYVRWEQFRNGKLKMKEWVMPENEKDTYTVIFHGFTVLKNGQPHHSAATLSYHNMKKEHVKALQASILGAFGQLNEAS